MHREVRKSLSSPRIGGAQRMSSVGSTLCGTGDHGAGRAVVLVDVLALRRSRRHPDSSCGCRGDCYGGYRPLGVAWQSVEGLSGRGLAPVKARAAFEGRAHANRGS
jgi:hypothetical protein